MSSIVLGGESQLYLFTFCILSRVRAGPSFGKFAKSGCPSLPARFAGGWGADPASAGTTPRPFRSLVMARNFIGIPVLATEKGKEKVCDAKGGVSRACARYLGKSGCPGFDLVRSQRRLWTFMAALAALTMSSCSAPTAYLIVSAPSTVTAGVPFTVTVTAMVNGERDTIIDGPIHFTTSDPIGVFPTLYVFTAADAGQHTFVNAITLNTPGNQTLTCSDYIAPVITGTTDVTVTAANDDGQHDASAPANFSNRDASKDEYAIKNDAPENVPARKN